MFRFSFKSELMVLSLLLVTYLYPFAVNAKDIDVESRVSEVIVYNDRGTVTRSAKVEIPAGEHVLVFKGIPLSIYSDSLKAKGSSKASVVFGAITHKRESSEDYIVPLEKELNDKIEALQDQVNVFSADKRALSGARIFLENLGKTASLRENEEIAKIELNSDGWAGAADALFGKLSENYKATLDLDIKIRDTQSKINKLREELGQIRTGHKQSYIVRIPFDSDKDSVLDVDLSYQIPNVGWEPVYDARLDTKSGKLDLVQYGSVWQRTGEDWDDVKLTLSTAKPSRGAGLPDLRTNWLSLYDRQAMKRNAGGGNNFGMVAANISSAPMQRKESFSDAIMEVGEDEEVKEASFRLAKIDTSGFVGEYKITGPASVKSDGTKSKLLVGGFNIESKLQVQIKPQISRDAYLVSKAVLKGDAPILPGQVSLFRDGAYIGKSNMKMLRPDEETLLAFGIDDNVSVIRNTIKDEKSEAGMISKDSVLERHFVTRIKNLHNDPVDVAVLETIPVPKDERIRVEIIKDITTGGYKRDVDDIKGLIEWSATFNPKQEQNVNLGWKVSWPKGENIQGL